MKKNKVKNISIRQLCKKALSLWSTKIRSNDNYTCQWCGSNKKLQAHHIVARSLCSKLGWFDLRNGITLCYRCHIYRIHLEPDEYIEMRDKYLDKKSLNYFKMRELYLIGKNIKITVDMYKILIKNLSKHF